MELNNKIPYDGFPIIAESCTNNWCYGAITDYINSDESHACTSGDGFVVAPDGSRAGLVWEIGNRDIEEIVAPEGDRWGVWAVWFPRPVKTTEDLVFNFRYILPSLQQKFWEIQRTCS